MVQPVTGRRAARRPGRPGRRLALLAAAAAAWCAAGLLAAAPPAAAATLTGATWTVSKSVTSATAVTYGYTFTAVTAATLTSVTMTVPATTTGPPTVGPVRPASLSGGTAVLTGTTLTYSFSATPVAAGTAVSIQLGGLTNTSAAGSYSATVTSRSSAGAVDSGGTGTVVLTAAAVGSPSWTSTSAAVGASASYTFGFTVLGLLGAITSVTMTVPPGTTGTPTLGPVSPGGLLGGSISLSGTTLTYSGIAVTIGVGAPVSIQVNGLVNTATAGTYTSEIVATGLLSISSGITGPLTFTGGLSLTAPGTLGWGATLTGASQSVADPAAGDQKLTVDDETNTGAGWHLTLSATTFTVGAKTLPRSGTLVFTSLGSVSSSTRPSVACAASCIPPGNTAAYPVAITTVASAPTPSTIFDAPAGTGIGPVTIGGSAAASPIGWWVTVPGNALAGSYISTITVQLSSGP